MASGWLRSRWLELLISLLAAAAETAAVAPWLARFDSTTAAPMMTAPRQTRRRPKSGVKGSGSEASATARHQATAPTTSSRMSSPFSVTRREIRRKGASSPAPATPYQTTIRASQTARLNPRTAAMSQPPARK